VQTSRVAVAMIVTSIAACGTGSSGAATERTSAPTLSASSAAPRADSVEAAPSSFIKRVRGKHDARQLVVVTASDYSTVHVTVRTYRHRDGAWHLAFGPWHGYIGGHGFARPGEKREGDLQTPSGSYTFPFAFGVDPDPGTRLRYRRALETSRWDDDPTSANYNRWVDIRSGDPGDDPEHMRLLPQYRYGAVIGYNLERTPYLGSAIFLHVDDGSATAGCVAVSRHRVVKVLRWLRPRLHPRIVMGTRDWVTR
jgi:L,D-peptidoglycan transpeptidase YkuD (ErfK/YbiS/YcfS/YnhG family)